VEWDSKQVQQRTVFEQQLATSKRVSLSDPLLLKPLLLRNEMRSRSCVLQDCPYVAITLMCLRKFYSFYVIAMFTSL